MNINRITGLLLLVTAAAGSAMAGSVDIPEIGAASAAGAVSLLTGAVLILRSRRRKPQ